MSALDTLSQQVRLKAVNLQNNRRLLSLARQVGDQAMRRITPEQAPVILFNASTRIGGISQNAAFAFLTGCALQLAGAPVINFACQAGMSRCVLGTDKDNPQAGMPCRTCQSASFWLYANAPTQHFTYVEDSSLAAALKDKTVPELGTFAWPLAEKSFQDPIPLGELALPALRWTLRRQNLVDDEPTRFLFREYMLSAYRVAQEFAVLVERVEPRSLVVFNGVMFPEAAARWVAEQRGIRVVTFEVGLQPFTVYFTAGDATAYPIDIPESFQLSDAQNARLDAYLEQRFQGKFTMAGIRFWPEMSALDADFLAHIAKFRQMVPVFSNVIFDTSQVHANRVFRDMFQWLDEVLEIARQHPETLFVLRAHPDEMRPGKESRESVAGWVARTQADRLPNLVFFNSNQYISSYELIRRAKFVMVYNSSIGLEASLMGAAVLNGGKARYTQLPIVYFPESIQAHQRTAEEFLSALQVDPDPVMRLNARRFLYYQLFRTSLPFEQYLDRHPNQTMVTLRKFSWQQLDPEYAPVLKIITDGILHAKPFLLESD